MYQLLNRQSPRKDKNGNLDLRNSHENIEILILLNPIFIPFSRIMIMKNYMIVNSPSLDGLWPKIKQNKRF